MNYVNIDTNNKTKIVATKQVVENLRTNEAIRNFLISSVSDIFKDKEILKKQKIVAIKNLVKDLKIALKNEAFNYSLNLVIRNLNEYHNLQKSETKDENGKIKKIIYFSSGGTVYGKPNIIPIPEIGLDDDPIKPAI